MKLFRPTLLSLACLLVLPAPASDLPSLGDSSSGVVSPGQEHMLGRAWLSMLRGQVQTLSDPLLKDYVESTIYRLAETSQVEDRRFEFILMNSPELNAFAAPGGIIGINGGLFLHAETEAEYASVLAHELAHLSQRHFARGIEEQQRMQLPMMAALLLGVVAAAAGAGDAGMAAITSSQAAAYQSQTAFSRQNEQEADRVGLLNLERAGYDPRAMPAMFERLVREYRFDQKPPEFLLTHPLTESRIADTRNRADQAPAGGKENSLRYQLISARMKLQFENTPGLVAKEFQARLSDNPKDDVARYGLTIAQIKAGQFETARSTLAPLLAKAPGELIYNLAQTELDIDSNHPGQASERLKRLLQLYPTSLPVQQMQVDLLLKQGNLEAASRLLEDMVSQRSTDPGIWYQVAEIRGQTGNLTGVYQARAEYFALVGRYEDAFQQLDYAKRRSTSFQEGARLDARLKELQNEKRMIDELFN